MSRCPGCQAWLAAHEFDENEDDGTMCLCGVPRDQHHLVEVAVSCPWNEATR